MKQSGFLLRCGCVINGRSRHKNDILCLGDSFPTIVQRKS